MCECIGERAEGRGASLARPCGMIPSGQRPPPHTARRTGSPAGPRNPRPARSDSPPARGAAVAAATSPHPREGTGRGATVAFAWNSVGGAAGGGGFLGPGRRPRPCVLLFPGRNAGAVNAGPCSGLAGAAEGRGRAGLRQQDRKGPGFFRRSFPSPRIASPPPLATLTRASNKG